jgi:Nucleoside permease
VTRSELMTIMTSGMAHVAGGIMGASIAFAIEAKHILTAVIMTAPGTLLVAKMLVPVAWLIGIPWHDATSVGNLQRRRWISLWMAFDIFGISLR